MKSRNSASSLVLTPRKYEQAVPLQPGGKDVVNLHVALEGGPFVGQLTTDAAVTVEAVVGLSLEVLINGVLMRL